MAFVVHAEKVRPRRGLVFVSAPLLTSLPSYLAMAATAAAAHIFCATTTVSPADCRPRALGGHPSLRVKHSRCLTCRASLGPDGSLAVLGGPSPKPVPPRGKPYLRQNSCLIFPPLRGHRPLAVIKFLGGAFIGAVPEVTYG